MRANLSRAAESILPTDVPRRSVPRSSAGFSLRSSMLRRKEIWLLWKVCLRNELLLGGGLRFPLARFACGWGTRHSLWFGRGRVGHWPESMVGKFIARALWRRAWRPPYSLMERLASPLSLA